MSMKFSRPLRILVLLFALALAGCDAVEVLSGVEQSQANRVVAALSQHGVFAVAKRQGSSGKGFNVEVSSDDYVEAINLLQELSLPGESRESFNDILKTSGLLPDLKEVEDLRIDRALATQVEDLLSNLPGVISVKAMVSLKREAGQGAGQITVVVQKLAGGTLVEDTLRQLLLPVIPGVEAANIHINFVDRPTQVVKRATEAVENSGGKLIYQPLVPFLRYFRVPASDYNRLRIILLAMMGLTAFVCGSLGFLVGYRYELLKGSSRRDSSRRKQG